MSSSQEPFRSLSRVHSAHSPARRDEKRARLHFKSLFQTHFGQLCRFAERYVHVPAVAEEVVQDVFMDVWHNRAHFSADGPPKTYLYKATRHRALDRVRRQRTERQWIDEAQADAAGYATNREQYAPDKDLHHKDLEDAVQRAVQDLPEQQRRVYVLHRRHHLTYAEIAEVMEISVHTVDTHMTRAFASLREQLADWLPFAYRKDG